MRRDIIRNGIAALAVICGITSLTPATSATAAAAASATAAAATSATAAAASATPAAAASMSSQKAVRIVLQRSGGFAGNRDAFVVDRSTVGGNHALRTAGTHAFRSLRSSYSPANSCCDRYSYRITAYYRDGDRKTISAVQGTTAPRVLWDVIAEAERVGVRPLPAAGAARS